MYQIYAYFPPPTASRDLRLSAPIRPNARSTTPAWNVYSTTEWSRSNACQFLHCKRIRPRFTRARSPWLTHAQHTEIFRQERTRHANGKLPPIEHYRASDSNPASFCLINDRTPQSKRIANRNHNNKKATFALLQDHRAPSALMQRSRQ